MRLLATIVVIAFGFPAQAETMHIGELARRVANLKSFKHLYRFHQLVGYEFRLAHTPRIVRLPNGQLARVVPETGGADTPTGPRDSAFRRALYDRIIERPQMLLPGNVFEDRTRALPWSEARIGDDPVDQLRAAVINAMGKWTDAKGRVDLAAIRRDVGERGGLRELIDAIADTPVQPRVRIQSHDLLAHLEPAVRDKIVAAEAPHLVPEMPALPWLAQRYDPRGTLFAKRRFFGLQHLVGNTVGLLETARFDPKLSELWGKPYSLEAMVGFALQGRGFTLNSDLFHRDRKRFITELQAELEAIKDPAAQKGPRFVLLDDGGEMIAAVARLVKKRFPGHAQLFAGVEQTTKGRRRLAKMRLPFTVVDVAGSWGKRIWANRMYGYAIFNEAHRLVQQYEEISGWRPKTAVVIGNGKIGNSVLRAAKRAARESQLERIVLWDDSKAVRDKARQNGLIVAASKEEALAQAELLISTVGKPVVRMADLKLLPRQAILVNGASHREFRLKDASVLRSQPQPGWIDDDTYYITTRDVSGRTDASHVIYNIYQRKDDTPRHKVGYVATNSFKLFENARAQGKVLPEPEQILIAAKGGGVMNFPQATRGAFAGSAIPGRYIQLDLGLLYLGLVQAIEGGDKGLVALNNERQRELVRFVERSLNARGESLRRPSWDFPTDSLAE